VTSVLALNCTLKRGNEPSSTDKLIDNVLAKLRANGCTVDQPVVRVVNLNILPGVKSDEGEGDDWQESASASWLPTFCCSEHRSGLVSLPVSPSGFWNAWTHSSVKLTTKDAWCRSGRSR